MKPITIKGRTFTVTFDPETFFPMTVDKTKKFIKLILRECDNETEIIEECIKALDDLIETIEDRYKAAMLKADETDKDFTRIATKEEAAEIRREAQQIKKSKSKLERNKTDLLKEAKL